MGSACILVMQRKFTRAVCAGALATLAVIAVICVVDNEVAHEDSGKDLRGDNLLKKQAEALDAIRAEAKKGKDMQSFDDMLHGFQSAPDAGLTAILVGQAPKKSDVDVALAPESLGIVPPTKPDHYLTSKELALAPKKDTGGDAISRSLALGDEYSFVQEYASVEEWRPKGQIGLPEAISTAKVEDEKQAIKDDGLEGASILSANHMGDYDLNEARDLLFLQTAASDDNGAEWTPTGQSTLNTQLASVHSYDATHKKKNPAGLQGDSVLSAIGVKEAPSTKDFNIVPEIDPRDLMLTQVSTKQWVPHGQTGMASAIATASVSDEADAVKADGLGGTDILSAASSPVPESQFFQTPQDMVSGWKPHGQKMGDIPPSKEGVHTIKVKKSAKKAKKPWHRPSALDGDNILSAVSLGHHIKKKDEAMELMTQGANDFDAFALLRDN